MDFIGAKDAGCGDDNWSYKTCKHPVKSSPPANQHQSTLHFRGELPGELTRNNNCLHYLIPDMGDPAITDRLGSANKFPVIFARTNRFKNSFICYGLANYQ